jgi:hypothetical protein
MPRVLAVQACTPPGGSSASEDHATVTFVGLVEVPDHDVGIHVVVEVEALSVSDRADGHTLATGSRRICRRSPAARPGRCHRRAAHWRSARATAARAGCSLCGAAGSIPVHVAILVAGCRCGERDRCSGRDTKRHSALNREGASRDRIRSCNRARLDRQATAGRLRPRSRAASATLSVRSSSSPIRSTSLLCAAGADRCATSLAACSAAQPSVAPLMGGIKG